MERCLNQLIQESVPLEKSNNTTRDMAWRKELEGLKEGENTWFTAPWLLIECFMYYLLQKSVESIVVSVADFDLFYHLKLHSLKESLPIMESNLLVFDTQVGLEGLQQIISLSLWYTLFVISIVT